MIAQESDTKVIQRETLTLQNVPDRPLSIAEVAQIMSVARPVTPAAVYKWIADGVKIKRGRPERVKLRAARLPGSMCVMPEALQEFIAVLNGDESARYKGMTEAEILNDQRARRGHAAHVPG